jgi:F-type H+-transporting ATPase subunit delta
MARPVTAARRYAEAAFELALRDGTEDAWAQGLRAASRFTADEAVVRLLENPGIPLEDRLTLLRTVLGIERLRAAVGDQAPESLRGRLAAIGQALDDRVGKQLVAIAELLLSRGRIDLLSRVADEYQRLLDRHREISPAVVTSAAPLTDDEIATIHARAEDMAGTTVRLTTDVDPGLLGGLTIQVGDRFLDASIRGRLERLRRDLLSGARTR